MQRGPSSQIRFCWKKKGRNKSVNSRTYHRDSRKPRRHCVYLSFCGVPLPSPFPTSNGENRARESNYERVKERTDGTDRCEKEKRITGPTNSEAGQTAGYKTVDRRRSQHQSRLTSLSCSTQAANMKVVIVLLAVAVCVLAEEKYTTKYDNIDVDQILRSERLLNNYVNCLLEKGSCTPDGKELKKSLPDALQNKCSKCSEKQKTGSEKVIRFLIHEKPQVWERLSKKYDPTGVHTENFKEEAKQRGIIL